VILKAKPKIGTELFHAIAQRVGLGFLDLGFGYLDSGVYNGKIRVDMRFEWAKLTEGIEMICICALKMSFDRHVRQGD
jgi:hypothetical protein